MEGRKGVEAGKGSQADKGREGDKGRKGGKGMEGMRGMEGDKGMMGDKGMKMEGWTSSVSESSGLTTPGVLAGSGTQCVSAPPVRRAPSPTTTTEVLVTSTPTRERST